MPLSLRVRRACCVVALFVFPPLANAADWKPLILQLSGKISAATGPGVIALEVANRSSISAPEVESIRRELVSSLATAGVRVWQPEQAAGLVRLTLSESLQNYVWVAEVRQGTDEPSILIVSTPRPDSSLVGQNTLPLTIHATTLLSRPEQILDAVVIEGSPRRLLVLGTDAVTPYEFRDGHWVAGPPLAIAHDRPLPRDPRGRIILRKDHLFDAYLPGLVCRSTNSSPMSMACTHNDDPWPLQAGESSVSGFFAPARNFFTGALVPGIGKQKSAPPFYSAAVVQRENYSLWIFAGVDGQLRLLDGINQQALSRIHWGSDIATIRTPCRPGSQVLATSADNEAIDTIQAFEFPDREPVAVSPKLELNGNITALWTAENGESAIAVIRNAENGNYEASLLNLACSE
jgi:hypothetical protein